LSRVSARKSSFISHRSNEGCLLCAWAAGGEMFFLFFFLDDCFSGFVLLDSFFD
jgi:hypothetical protein